MTGSGAARGRREETRGRLLRRGEVSTVDSFDKGSRINGLIAGVRVVLRIGEGVRKHDPPPLHPENAASVFNASACTAGNRGLASTLRTATAH